MTEDERNLLIQIARIVYIQAVGPVGNKLPLARPLFDAIKKLDPSADYGVDIPKISDNKKW